MCLKLANWFIQEAKVWSQTKGRAFSLQRLSDSDLSIQSIHLCKERISGQIEMSAKTEDGELWKEFEEDVSKELGVTQGRLGLAENIDCAWSNSVSGLHRIRKVQDEFPWESMISRAIYSMSHNMVITGIMGWDVRWQRESNKILPGLLRVLESRMSFLKNKKLLFMCIELSIEYVVWFAKWKNT